MFLARWRNWRACASGSARCPCGTQSACEGTVHTLTLYYTFSYLTSALHFSVPHFCTTLFSTSLLHYTFHSMHLLFRIALHFLHSLFSVPHFCTSGTSLHLLFCTSLPALTGFTPPFSEIFPLRRVFPGVGSRKELNFLLKLILYYPPYPPADSPPPSSSDRPPGFPPLETMLTSK